MWQPFSGTADFALGWAGAGFEPGTAVSQSHCKNSQSSSYVDNGGAGPNNVGVGKFQPAHHLVLRPFCKYVSEADNF
jgi:hypothetical protein